MILIEFYKNKIYNILLPLDHQKRNLRILSKYKNLQQLINGSVKSISDLSILHKRKIQQCDQYLKILIVKLN